MSANKSGSITTETVQKPTLSEVAKIFRPSKKDLIELAREVLRQEREKYVIDINAELKAAKKEEDRDCLE